MKQTVGFPKIRPVFKPLKHPLKLTALLYLKEALQEEKYELCAQFIRVAREFGASPPEIRALLEDSRRVPSG